MPQRPSVPHAATALGQEVLLVGTSRSHLLIFAFGRDQCSPPLTDKRICRLNAL
jgi:hypothetical protein